MGQTHFDSADGSTLVASLTSGTSGVTTTASPLSMFTPETRACGHEWRDEYLGIGRSEMFIHVSGPKFVAYGDMWLARHDSLPTYQSEARNRFQLPDRNPATHVHIFYFEIPDGFDGLCSPVVLMASKEIATGVWQAKIQDQLVGNIRLVQSIELKTEEVKAHGKS